MGSLVCQCSESESNTHDVGSPNRKSEPNLIRLRHRNQVAQSDESDCQKWFRKVAVLGTGAYSTVFLAQLHLSGAQRTQLVALKQIAKRKLRNARLVQEILTEKSIMVTFKSDFLLNLHCSFQDHINCYFVTDFARGGDMDSFIYRRDASEKDTAFRASGEVGPRFIFACIVEAISHLHDRGYIYRDLKPENILIFQDGYAKLGDFGLACSFDDLAKNKTFAGTAGYEAPEIVQRLSYGRQVDLWSMGVVLYEMIFGDLPFDQSQVARTHFKYASKEFEKGHIWPQNVQASSQAKDLICSLMRTDPKRRIGAESWHHIRQHAFFKGFDWDALSKKQLVSPLLPAVQNLSLKYSSSQDDIQTAADSQAFQHIQDFQFYDEAVGATF